jgi:translation initiation factor 3 subunit I
MRPFHVRGTDRAIMTLKINYDGDLFFTASQDGGINCWLTENGERLDYCEHRLGNYKASGAVKTLDLTDNSEILVSGSLEV